MLSSVVCWQQAGAVGLKVRMHAPLKNLQKLQQVVPLPALLDTTSMPVSVREFVNTLNAMSCYACFPEVLHGKSLTVPPLAEDSR